MQTDTRFGGEIYSSGLLSPGEVWAFASLPSAGRVKKGTKAYTTEFGAVVSDGAAWHVEVSDSPATSITYDDETPKRVLTYVKNGVAYTCTYYTSGNGDGKLETVVGGGVTRTYTYNSDGLLTDEVIS